MKQSFPLFKNNAFTAITYLLMAFLFASTSMTAQVGFNYKDDIPDCPDEPCPCRGNYAAIQVYYFGTGTVDVAIYKDLAGAIPITSFAAVAPGQLLTIDGTALPAGTLGYKTYLFVTDASGETCVTKIHTSCPSLGWPISSEDLKIIGKKFGDFTVYSRTDSDSNFLCDVSNVDQDWHVGGNIIGPSNNTLGTRNAESVVFITNDLARGTITSTGDFGINTVSPTAKLDVQGDVLINETLDVNGVASIHDLTGSTATTDGALIVAGGAGIGENLHVGNDANIGNDLSVNRDALVGRNLEVAVDATVFNDLEVGNDATVGNDLDVAHDAAIGNDVNVVRDVQIGRNLSVTDNATVGQDLDVANDANIGQDLSVNNNASITNQLQVGQSATIAQNISVGNNANIGNDLDVNGDANIDGIVTIGTNNTPNMLGTVSTAAFQLFVDGGILTEEVLVRTGWADYVFEKDYVRPTLEEVEKHINTHGHLPNTPSAKEVTENGLSLGESTVNQQEKIEELFLYIIEMNKDIKALQEENKTLRAALQSNK